YIAGHRGLVGSAIVKNLQSKGYTNLVYKTHKELDLTNQKAVEKFFKVEKPEFVILAAAKVGGIVANNTYRADFIYENLAIQNNVIHQSYVHGVKKLLFLGSTCIYPKEAPQPMSEDALLTSPLEYTNEPYAIAKIAGIKMCESYNIQYGTNFISVMPTNLYGPNDNFDLEKSHVLPALLRKIHLGKLLENGDIKAIKKDLSGTQIATRKSKAVISEKSSDDELFEVLTHYGIKTTHNSQLTTYDKQPKVAIEIWGSGKPRREFLWSEDMAKACVHIMEKINFKDILDSRLTTHNSQFTTYEIRNTHINIGTGVDISIKDLAKLIKEIVGFKGELYFNADKPDGTMVKLTDPSKLHSLGWGHNVELEQGIKKMYSWYLKNNKV
ncbi:GDP-L-fucose synthase, partial [Aliarcobacter skirrowii]|uniref:GDP-L-fucose synthase family protein n=1 Tax=Aliarcobacter skirrowii TaxID=28200 RepID=UPI002A36B3BC